MLLRVVDDEAEAVVAAGEGMVPAVPADFVVVVVVFDLVVVVVIFFSGGIAVAVAVVVVVDTGVAGGGGYTSKGSTDTSMNRCSDSPIEL